jgi:hypothetical protein
MQVLLPVWGSAYLRQCLDICIPSLLAPGNLPALAAALPTTFVLSTRGRDMPWVRAHPAWRALAALCEARLDDIDPLLSQASSVVLTLAYARAIRAAAAAARDTGFVFLVADYVMADGALLHVMQRLRDGADAILAGNFQIALESARGLRAAARSEDGEALSIAPRALVRLGLASLHPATRACIADGDTPTHDAHANRVFWRVGSGTLLGRFYLLHMVAIRPQTLDVTIAAPCDYSFVPEFCPAGRVETITDSDEYLVAELLPAAAGPRGVRPGALAPATLARSLAEWATARHRRNAADPIVFHAAAPEDGLGETELAEALARSDLFVGETERRLGPTARPHRPHPYWAGALDHHQATALHPVDRAALVAILGPGGVPEASGGLRRRLLGRMPSPRPWHPHWSDLRAVRARLATLAPERRLLIVSGLPGRLRAHLLQVARSAGAVSVAHLEPEDLLAAAAAQRLRCDAVLLVIPPDADAVPDLLRALAATLPQAGPLVLALTDLSDGATRTIAPAALVVAAETAGPALRVAGMRTVPAPRWRIAAQAGMMARARAAARGGALARRLVHLLAGIAWAGLSLAANLVAARGAEGSRRAQCSTALFDLVRARLPEGAVPPSQIARRMDTAMENSAMAAPWTA